MLLKSIAGGKSPPTISMLSAIENNYNGRRRCV